MEYVKLTEDKLDEFIRLRINQLREEGATEDIDLVPALKDYYIRHLADGTFVSWLAMDGNAIVGTSGMSFVEKPPYFTFLFNNKGFLLYQEINMSVKRRHRHIRHMFIYGFRIR